MKAALIPLLAVILSRPLAAQPLSVVNPTLDLRNRVADPVDIPTGIYLRSYIDIAIYDTVPILFKRQYRNLDPVSRAFGIGTSHVYDWYLWSGRSDGSYVDLILEDGNRVHYIRKNPGTGYQDAVYVNTSSPTGFLNSEMRWDAGKWKLSLLDGTVYKFLPCGNRTRQKCRLVDYQDSSGGWLRLTRDADSNLLSIVNPRNRGITFRNDSVGRVTQARIIGADQIIRYEYDAQGRLKHVANTGLRVYSNRKIELAILFLELIGWLPKRVPESIDYEYDAAHNMTKMIDSTEFQMENKYDSSGRTIHQKLSDGRSWSMEYVVDKDGNILQADVKNPDGTIERLTFDLNHNTLTETHPLGLRGEMKWTYERDATTGQVVAIEVECLSRNGTMQRYHGTVGPDKSADILKRNYRANCKQARETQ